MATTTQTRPQDKPTFVVTGKVRMSYAKVFKPDSVEEGGEKKYSVALLISKSDKFTLDKINRAIEAAKQEGLQDKFGGTIPKKFKLPLRDGDEEKDDDPNYAGHYWLNASSTNKPRILDQAGNEIMDPADFYSGCYGRASLNFYAFNTNGNKGIAVGLNNLQKLADGPALAGGTKAEDDFATPYDDQADEDDNFLD